MAVAGVSSNTRKVDGNAALVETTLKEMRKDGPQKSSSAVEKDSKSTVGGGVEDVYGEDSATEHQYITPWTVTVARYR